MREDAFFEVWWALYRRKRWQKIRPDMGSKPSEDYLLGLKNTAKLGWMARAMLNSTQSKRCQTRSYGMATLCEFDMKAGEVAAVGQ